MGSQTGFPFLFWTGLNPRHSAITGRVARQRCPLALHQAPDILPQKLSWNTTAHGPLRPAESQWLPQSRRPNNQPRRQMWFWLGQRRPGHRVPSARNAQCFPFDGFVAAHRSEGMFPWGCLLIERTVSISAYRMVAIEQSLSAWHALQGFLVSWWWKWKQRPA